MKTLIEKTGETTSGLILTCPACGEDRRQLTEWLNEPLAWETWPNTLAGGTWFRTENCQKAVILVSKCSECQTYFQEENK